MNAQTQLQNSNQSVGLLNLDSFELSQRIAKMLSSSTLVPEQYRATIQKKAGKDSYGNQLWREEPNPNGLSNCVIALNMSNRMGADPLMVMQNLYLVNGRPSWSSQFIMAGINSSGRFSALRFEIEDLGEKEIEYSETVWEDRKPKKITKSIKVNDFSCIAWAIERETGERLESSKITIEMAVKEGWYTKEGSKWQTMSEQMLRYRAASFFGRVYAPELLMGLRSAEEEKDRIIDVTPVADSTIIQASNFKQLKALILKAKSLNALEENESAIYALSDESERNELIKLYDAQKNKFTVVDVPVAEEKKPEPKEEKAPPRQTATESKASIDPVKSLSVLSNLKEMVANTNDLNELETGVANSIKEAKPNLTTGHHQDILATYAARKEILSQQDIFDEKPPTSFVDGAIARIRNARSQDDINDVYADPFFEELPTADRERIDSEAQQREAELQD